MLLQRQEIEIVAEMEKQHERRGQRKDLRAHEGFYYFHFICLHEVQF